MSLFQRFFILVFLACLQPCLAEGMSEGQIKSAYTLNFIKFAEWPAGTIGADKQITLCIVGSDVLGGALAELNGRQAGGRQLRTVQYANADANLTACHVIFIGESVQHKLAAIIKALGDTPALTISDIENFAERGGDIGLLYHENRIVFEVNLASVQKSKLRLPSQVLNLASYVFGR